MIRNKSILRSLKEYLKFFLGFPLTLVSFVSIARFIYLGKDELLSKLPSFNLLPFVLGVIILLLFFLLRSYVWQAFLKNEGYDVGIRDSTYLLANAEIKRFVPGSILSFVSRVRNFGSLNIPAKAIVRLIFLESSLFVITSGLVSVPAMLYFFAGPWTTPLILTAAIVFILLILFFKKKVGFRSFGKSFFFMISAWVFYGLGTYLISTSIFFINPEKILEVSSLFVLSWLVGYLVLIVPMGLGVREGVTTLGLTALMPVSFAASIALIARLIFVVCEVLFLTLSYFAHKYITIKQRIRYQLLILWTAIISYVLYFTYYSFQKHLNFFTGRFDLGNMDQTVWNTFNGRIFQFTNPDGTETISRLAIHADFILVLLAPFYLIWDDPRILLLIQTVTLGAGAYFVFLIAKHVLKDDTISLALGISFLLNPFVQKQNLFDFHAVALSTTFLLAAFYYTLVKNNKLFFLFLALAVLTKENVYAIASIFGFYLTFQTKNKKWLYLSISSLLIFYLLISVLIPSARGGQHFATEYFAEFGDTPPEILLNLILNPFKTLSSILTSSNISYIYKLFLPVGFLSFLSPFYILFAVPDLAINLLSENMNLKSITFHYAATIIPFIYVSAIFALRKIVSIHHNFSTRKIILYVIVFFSVFSTFQYGVLPGSKNPSLEIYNSYLPQRDKIRDFIQKIPQELSVASSNNLGAHLSHRLKLYTIPQGLEEADVVLFLLNDVYASPSLGEQRDFSYSIMNNPEYIELYRIGDFIAFAKRSAAGKILAPY